MGNNIEQVVYKDSPSLEPKLWPSLLKGAPKMTQVVLTQLVHAEDAGKIAMLFQSPFKQHLETEKVGHLMMGALSSGKPRIAEELLKCPGLSESKIDTALVWALLRNEPKIIQAALEGLFGNQKTSPLQKGQAETPRDVSVADHQKSQDKTFDRVDAHKDILTRAFETAKKLSHAEAHYDSDINNQVIENVKLAYQAAYAGWEYELLSHSTREIQKTEASAEVSPRAKKTL